MTVPFVTLEYRSWVPQVDDLPKVVKKVDENAPAGVTLQDEKPMQEVNYNHH